MFVNQIKDNFEFRPFQKEAIKFLIDRPRAILAMCTGSGKTITFLSAFAACRKLNKGVRAIIVCDGSSMVSIKEGIEEKTNFIYQIIESKEYSIENTDLLLMTYDRAVDVIPKLDLSYYSHIIFDEAHALKNPGSGLVRTLKPFVNSFSYIWFSTATIMNNDIMDIYGMMDFLIPGFFHHPIAFKNKYCLLEERKVKVNRRHYSVGGPGKQYQAEQLMYEIVGYKNLDQLKAKLDPYIYFYSIDYNIIFNDIKVYLDKSELELYKLASKGFDYRKLRSDDKVNYSVRLHDLQLVLDNNVARGRPSSKMDALRDWLMKSEMDGGIVYFSYRESLDNAYNLFGGQFEIEIISGDVKSKDRSRVRNWLGPGKFVFMTSAGSQSLNLDNVNKILLFDIPYSVVEVSQIIGRVARISSKYSEFIITMMNTLNTIDQYRVALIGIHHQLVKDIVGGYSNLRFFEGGYSIQDLKDMRRKFLWKGGK